MVIQTMSAKKIRKVENTITYR